MIYNLIKEYVRFGLIFYFKKIELKGLDNIPYDKPVLFTANHQNAFLDALLIAAAIKRKTWFLVRAGIFINVFIKALLSTINLMPIYRIRDGKMNLSKNEGIFRKCSELLVKNKAIFIFPEGNHDIRRRLRPLSKGFTRIVFGAIEHGKLEELYIVPIGLNYQHHSKFRSRVSIIFGPAVNAVDFQPKEPMELRHYISGQMKQLITNIESEDYENIVSQLKNINVNYLDPVMVNKMVKDNDYTNRFLDEPGIFYRIMHVIATINNLMVILIWKVLVKRIKDAAFIGSIKFTFGIFMVPFIYLFQAILVGYFFEFLPALIYLITSIWMVKYLS